MRLRERDCDGGGSGWKWLFSETACNRVRAECSPRNVAVRERFAGTGAMSSAAVAAWKPFSSRRRRIRPRARARKYSRPCTCASVCAGVCVRVGICAYVCVRRWVWMRVSVSACLLVGACKCVGVRVSLHLWARRRVSYWLEGGLVRG